MIRIITGDALNHHEGLIVHGCNCRGHMGGGFAAAVRERFPAVYTAYAFKHCNEGLKLGEIQSIEVSPFKFIVNAMTQDVGGNYHPDRNRAVEYDAVADCFEKVVQLADHIASENSGRRLPIVFPMIGAGIAGGNWEIIEKIIDVTIPDRFDKILYVLPQKLGFGFPPIVQAK